ncbi:MAG: tRNA uridine-5-carboxymethylaminomethyl(34) synthesis GTPase MnmE [Acidobacteriota bacterium]
MSDTIVALATPAGRSSIGVIRLSGDDSLAFAERLSSNDGSTVAPRTSRLIQLRNPISGEAIDEALVTYFKSPHSFTGEDVVEIACHGSPVVLRQVVDICLRFGARMAEAGEFSLRALANGRMDLSEAEAIRDLIDAQTTASARQAVRQLRGEFSHRLQPIKDELLDSIVVLESALEFVEDDLPEIQSAAVRSRISGVADAVGRLASTFKAGQLIREGLRIALVGRPNVGKSSLFNALVGSERAIVTDIAGTTRDQIHEKFTVGDIPISLIDTAGLRKTSDTVESIGVERSWRTMADVDQVIVILDASESITREDRVVVESVGELRHLFAINKIDKLPADASEKLLADFKELLPDSSTVVQLSAKTGEGISELKSALIEPFAASDGYTAGFLVTDARHHDLLVRAESEIRQSVDLLDKKMSEEIVLIGLHNALRYLGQITGETTTEDMLTRIFSTFCIGK